MKIQDWQSRKEKNEKISMITCYDYSFARLVNSSPIDSILVGDSLGMVMHGHSSTLPVSMKHMQLHTEAVVKGAPDKFIIADLPFMSYRKGLPRAMANMEILMKAGAQAVKLEGADGNLEIVKQAVQSGIPVMGHLGLTPQSIHMLGGFKVQGREALAQKKLKQDALALQDAGCFSIVFECVPSALAKEITHELEIPTIGIGAGPDCDGQVLVLQDMLGMNSDFKPKFLRRFFNAEKAFTQVFSDYHQAVQSKEFPNKSESYE